VAKEAKATRSGNARIHGMTCVTPASIAYIATQVIAFLSHFSLSMTMLAQLCFVSQVRFALSSSSVFSRTDKTTDSERFFTSLLGLFDDSDERQEVDDLLVWWNRYFILPFVLSGTVHE
jgi:hypothetical protein